MLLHGLQPEQRQAAETALLQAKPLLGGTSVPRYRILRKAVNRIRRLHEAARSQMDSAHEEDDTSSAREPRKRKWADFETTSWSAIHHTYDADPAPALP